MHYGLRRHTLYCVFGGQFHFVAPFGWNKNWFENDLTASQESENRIYNTHD